jgi:hypothetical protein
MEISPEAIELENRSIGRFGEPTLGQALEILLQQWDFGIRSRELALHLLFLCWYLMLEPPHITGMEASNPIADRLQAVFNEVHNHFRTSITNDAEMLYVVGLMAHLTPWLLGETNQWESISANYQGLYRQLAPNGLDPLLFQNRGAYGDYFGHQASIKDGY